MLPVMMKECVEAYQHTCLQRETAACETFQHSSPTEEPDRKMSALHALVCVSSKDMRVCDMLFLHCSDWV